MTGMPAASNSDAPLFGGVTLTMISWKAQATIQKTLESYESAGILDLFAQKRIHFNEISPADIAIARRFGFDHSGSAANTGIFGAVDAVAAQVRTPFILSLENDNPLVTDRAGLIAMLTSALADMEARSVPAFIMRSRREPGEQFTRGERYAQRFNLVWPLGTDASHRRPMANPLLRAYEDRRRSALRGSAIYAEEDPTRRHPRIIEKTGNGNWLTRSTYLNWSNCAVLARTDFLRNVVLDRVRNHPAPTTINGHQDIEAALKVNGWWRKQGFLIGQSEPGPFTHKRLDR
ncbi:MAG: hypothetical protein ABL901_07220 [Hyphomicrobiaceae bacterium]